MFDRKDMQFGKIITKRRALWLSITLIKTVFILSFMIITFGGGIYAGGSTTPSDYSIVTVDVNGATEYRFFFNEHHFMTLIDEEGTLNFRPHPGVDVNGWGSSWYTQPFLPGAELGHTAINSVEAPDTGISVDAMGNVSKGESSTYGTWSITMNFNYDQLKRIITGNGTYAITLDGPLSNLTGELNLYKIASNYLDDVPLLSGEMGDTGDMKYVDVVGDNFSFTWIPPDQPSHFPGNITDSLSIDVIGQYNNVDTVAQGYDPIEEAYKPSLKIMLTSQQADTQMIFGGIYVLEKSQDFWEDNVGITPLILTQSTRTDYQFDVDFESKVPDSDNDGIPDDQDNCRNVPNAEQWDSNSEEDDNLSLEGEQHYGNVCDTDYDNSGFVGLEDFNELRTWFGQSVPPALAHIDCDSDNFIGLSDFNCLRTFFGTTPGPGIGD